MLKVDIIYANSLSNHIGPSTNLRRLVSNKEEFRKRGVEFAVYSLDNLKENNSSELINYKIFKKALNNLISFFGLENNLYVCRLLIYLKYIRHSRRVLKNYYLKLEFNADIIVFDEFFTFLEYAKRMKKEKPSKIVVFHHGNGNYFKMFRMYFPGLRESKYLENLEVEFSNLIYQRIDKLVFVSKFALKNFCLINDYKEDKKIETLYCGVEEVDLPFKKNIKSEYINIICVGSVNKRKGQSLIVDAYIMLPKHIQNIISIDFLGAGGYELDRLKHKTKENNLEKKLRFHGAVDDISTFYQKADLFMLASLDEGLPISIIEALNYSLPIIGTNVAGIPETINGNGILIEPSIESVFKSLLSVNELDLLTLGLESKKIFQEKFAYKTYIENYSTLLGSV